MAQNFVKENNLKNVRILPFQKEEMLPFTLPLADVSIVSVDEGMEDLFCQAKLFTICQQDQQLLA